MLSGRENLEPVPIMKLSVQILAWSLYKLSYIQAKFRLGERSEIYCKVLHIIVLRVLQGDQKVSVHLMITIQKDTSNVQSVPRQSPDIY
jgi:hypothetical protein